MTGARPRVAFFGNVGNTHLGVVRALRESGVVDAHLFIDERDPAGWRPESDLGVMTDGYPSWVHVDSWVTPRTLMIPWRAPIVDHLKQFDLVVASHNAPVFAQFLGKPFAVLVTGGDLTVRPFPVAFRRRRGGVLAQAAHLIPSLWQRRGLRRAEVLWMQPFAPFREAADRLRIEPARRSRSYFPLALDTQVFCPGPPGPVADPATAAAFDDSDFAVFSPTRLVFDDSPVMRRSGQWKGSETLLRGWAQFVRSGVAERPVLVLPEWVSSEGVDEAKQRAAHLGISTSIHWARPPRASGFHRSELVELYRRADVVTDEFGVGWFGFVSLEGMACGVPVVSHVDLAVIDELYVEHPWIPAATPDELAVAFAELYSDPTARHALGQRARSFVERYHSLAGVAPTYRAAVVETLERIATSSVG